jgi:hypothetical protein
VCERPAADERATITSTDATAAKLARESISVEHASEPSAVTSASAASASSFTPTSRPAAVVTSKQPAAEPAALATTECATTRLLATKRAAIVASKRASELTAVAYAFVAAAHTASAFIASASSATSAPEPAAVAQSAPKSAALPTADSAATKRPAAPRAAIVASERTSELASNLTAVAFAFVAAAYTRAAIAFTFVASA